LYGFYGATMGLSQIQFGSSIHRFNILRLNVSGNVLSLILQIVPPFFLILHF
jgi:hypothetical protein